MGGLPSLAKDPTGNLHISYHDFDNEYLKYALLGEPSTIEVVDSVEYIDTTPYNDIAADSQGAPHICYIARILVEGKYRYVLKYATIYEPTDPPVADADGPYIVEEGTQISLDGSGSYDPDGGDLTYEWDLDGDGEPDSTDVHPSWTYMSDDTVTVTLTVTDDEGDATTCETTVTVLDLGPTASFTWKPETQTEDSPVQFTDTSASHPDDMTAWSWDFGDGSSSTEQNPTHTYDEDGVYTVILTVIDEDGSEDTAFRYISIGDLEPMAEFDWSPESPDEGSPVEFMDASTNQDEIMFRLWLFGDSSFGLGEQPTHVYQREGTYTATLFVVDDGGSFDTAQHEITVQGAGPLTVTIDIKPGSDPNSINLKSKGKVPVAVITTDAFDASTIDPESVEFAGAAPSQWSLEDVDGDGDTDIIFHFDTQELDLDQNSVHATLTGKTEDGTSFQGTDTVKIVETGKN